MAIIFSSQLLHEVKWDLDRPNVPNNAASHHKQSNRCSGTICTTVHRNRVKTFFLTTVKVKWSLAKIFQINSFSLVLPSFCPLCTAGLAEICFWVAARQKFDALIRCKTVDTLTEPVQSNKVDWSDLNNKVFISCRQYFCPSREPDPRRSAEWRGTDYTVSASCAVSNTISRGRPVSPAALAEIEQ